MEVYREPASPFVADFVGKGQRAARRPRAPGAGVLQHRRPQSTSSAGEGAGADGDPRLRAVKHLPAARRGRAGHGRSPPGDPNVFDAEIEKIEFLGSYCLVRVKSRRPGRAQAHGLPVAQLPGSSSKSGGRQPAAAAPAARAHARVFRPMSARMSPRLPALPPRRARHLRQRRPRTGATASPTASDALRGAGGAGAAADRLPRRAAGLSILLQSLQDKPGRTFVGLANFVELCARRPPCSTVAVEQPVGVGLVTADHGAAGLHLRLRAHAQPHATSSRCSARITLIPLLAPSLLSAISLIYWFGNQGVLKGWLNPGLRHRDQIYGAPASWWPRCFAVFPACADDPGHRAQPGGCAPVRGRRRHGHQRAAQVLHHHAARRQVRPDLGQRLVRPSRW